MDIAMLQRRALEISELYDSFNVSAGRNPWSGVDFTMGFVGDVGDLVKLVMAVEGKRNIDDARVRLGHELADCLWSVLADRYGVDLTAEFTLMTDEIEAQLTAKT